MLIKTRIYAAPAVKGLNHFPAHVHPINTLRYELYREEDATF